MDYYIAVAILITVFLGIILHSKKALTQKSTSYTPAHNCEHTGQFGLSQRSRFVQQSLAKLVMRSHGRTSPTPIPGARFSLGVSSREEDTKPTSQSDAPRAFQIH